MKLNANLTLTGPKAVLVPYRREHVPLYHAWMQSPELLEATASEPLTLEQEYEMQRTWAEDADKCTFIVLDRARPDTPGTGAHGGAMAGDVNLFLNDCDDDAAGEVDVMVAEPCSRGRGLATEALRLFLSFAAHELGMRLLRVRIGEANAASLALFAKLGFREVGRSAVFKEVTLELPVAARGGAGDPGEGIPWLMPREEYQRCRGEYDAARPAAAAAAAATDS